MVHTLPAVFTVGVAALLLIVLPVFLLVFPWWIALLNSLSPLLLWCLAVFTDSSIRNKSTRIGALSVVASFVQLTGYGSGFLRAWWLRCILGHDDEDLQAFRQTFYK